MEDFVPFEIAKKLKEKGFDCSCIGHYVNNQLYIAHYLNAFHSDKDESLDAPTISQVLKWLRSQEISVEPLSTPYNDWKCYVKHKGEIVIMISGDKYRTYEQAAIAGIEEVLDNLIENIMGKKDMSLSDYQRRAMTTCMSSCENYSYMFLNLVGEVGELASKVSKAIRTGHANINENKLDFESINLKQEMMLEAGDVLWQLSGLCSAMGWPLEEIAQMNLDKLKSRQERGVIAGNGDHR